MLWPLLSFPTSFLSLCSHYAPPFPSFLNLLLCTCSLEAAPLHPVLWSQMSISLSSKRPALSSFQFSAYHSYLVTLFYFLCSTVWNCLCLSFNLLFVYFLWSGKSWGNPAGGPGHMEESQWRTEWVLADCAVRLNPGLESTVPLWS